MVPFLAMEGPEQIFEEAGVEGGDDVGGVLGVPEGVVAVVDGPDGHIGDFVCDVEVGVGLEEAVAPGTHGR